MMARMLFVIFICSNLIIYFSSFAADPDLGKSVFLDRAFELEFKAESATFLIEYQVGQIELLPGLIQHSLLAQTEPSKSFSGIAGTQVEVPAQRDHFYAGLILESSAGQSIFLPARKVELSDKMVALNSSDRLREHLLLRKGVLQSWNLQVAEQEQSLNRLRDDAEVIGKVERIIELRDETKRVEVEIENLDKDFEMLRRFLSLIKANPAPKNFARRELELTGQLSKLAQAAKLAESGEMERKHSRESDLHYKLDVIESTRDEDPEELKQTLAGLRLKRMQLEKQRGQADADQIEPED